MNQKFFVINIFLIIIISLIFGCQPSKKVKIQKKSSEILIDGNIDAEWDKATIHLLDKSFIGKNNCYGENDFSGKFRTLWDDESLYFLYEITDDSLFVLPPKYHFNHNERDCILMLFDIAENTHFLNNSESAFKDDIQIYAAYDVDTLLLYPVIANVHFNIKTTEKGYIMEMSIPWKSLSFDPLQNKSFGFQTHIFDADKKMLRKDVYGIYETCITWYHDGMGQLWYNNHTQTNYVSLFLSE